MKIEFGDIRVEFEDIGEGLYGEYDKEDSGDIPLLRFYISHYKDGEWEDVEDTSYCTQVPTFTPEDEQQTLLWIIMCHIYFPLISSMSIKKICERLSWIDTDWLAIG